ncbi:MAG: Dyp-type peroxidase [Nocardioides sp.]
MSGFTRRGLVAGAGGTLALGAVGGFAARGYAGSEDAVDGVDQIDLTGSHEFYTGAHQVGVDTAPQRYLVYMTFDLAGTASRTDLQVLLARWSASIAQMMKGLPVGSVDPDRSDAVPIDTGEAYELEPASLTVTVGLGPGVFTDQFGLTAMAPRRLAELPTLPSDALQDRLTGGDLSLQACADDPQVAYHAIRDLTRIARGTATTRWVVMGFGRASAGRNQATPRNLMGFKDGTRNVVDDVDLDQFVWCDDDVDWMAGGTYQVARKIAMDIEIWDTATIGTQHQTFGRDKAEGAPLGASGEHDTPDFTATDADGALVIPATSHVALAAPENNDGVKILRRGYNYTDGLNDLGLLDAGLIFLSYQKDPEQFVRIQRRLGGSDQLNEYITHIGSAVFAIPPAPEQGHYIGEALFA